MNSDCFSCFGKSKHPFHFIYTDYAIIETEQDIIQYCILCDEELYKKLVYCKNCQYTIGHLSCVKKWLKKHQKCPNCKRPSFILN
jgi:hypothetical protein